MVYGVDLFFALFNNLAIFIAMITVYSYLLNQFKQSSWYKLQIILGLAFGIFAVGCMYAKIPVFKGVIVDQRNSVITLSGAFGGPLSAVISAILAGSFRIYLGGDGVSAGVIGISLAATAGTVLNLFSRRFDSMKAAAINALWSSVIILPGFLFVGDIQTGWKLMKAMMIPYGSAVFLGIFLSGLLLHREEERYEVERLFREREQQYRDLVEGTNDLITRTDKDGNFTFVNHVAEKMFGVSPEECIGLPAFQFIHPDDRDKTLDWFNQCVEHKAKQANIENRQVNIKTGKTHTVLWSSDFHYDGVGTLIGIGGIARDMTEHKELETQLLQVQKMESIGRLAGGIAHDFNNILVPIIGYVELGMMNLSPDDILNTYLKRVQYAAERAAKLTRQILAFSRKQLLEMHILDLNVVVSDFKSMVQRLISENIEFETFLSSDLYLIKADKGQLEQVLLNLVVNARDAMPAGGKLTIETANVCLDEDYVKKHACTHSPGYYVMLAVSDTGHGMDAETLQKIFEPFFTTKAKEEGTGLGLATVFGIVKQHGGNIWTYSEVDKGSTFKIYLPRTSETINQNEITRTEPLSTSGTETILVVEDESMVRKLVCETLSAYGYTVIEAQNGNEGMQRVSEYRETIHLLLTDVIMPEMNGKDLYINITRVHPDIKVLFMSGYTDNVIVHHGILEETVDFLQKPFTINSLTQKVRQVLS